MGRYALAACLPSDKPPLVSELCLVERSLAPMRLRPFAVGEEVVWVPQAFAEFTETYEALLDQVTTSVGLHSSRLATPSPNRTCLPGRSASRWPTCRAGATLASTSS